MQFHTDIEHFFQRHPHAVALLAAALLPCAPAAAQETQTADSADSGWQLGIAAGLGRQLNPFVDSDDIDIPVVLDIAWYGERFFFDNGDFGYTLVNEERFSLSAIATFVNERNYYSYLREDGSGANFFGSLTEGDRAGTADEGAELRGDAEAGPEFAGSDLLVDSRLPKRSFALHGGLELLWLTPVGDLQAQLSTDLSDTHGGQELWLSHTIPWFTLKERFALSWGLEWKSADLAGYYYGVRPEEVQAGRPFYRPGSALNAFVRFAASHELNEHWKLVSVLERKALDSSLHSSPVIDRDTVDSFFLGLYYQF